MRGTLLIAALLAAGCGNQIGDSCGISSDCSPNGDRICDTKSPGGYCTIQGCDHDSCPGEAVCVRFFTVTTSNRTCTADSECTVDEACTLSGYCAPLSSEVRYCMLACGGPSDCRDGYECRDQELMMEHGGQPVLDPEGGAEQPLQPFCAAAPVSQ
ncbi:MAG TPA: hypothetical protein VL172_15710 [Kofleriaceae bacterium]|nr:hypothetical protein [Kofleriaceae bacterium]